MPEIHEQSGERQEQRTDRPREQSDVLQRRELRQLEGEGRRILATGDRTQRSAFFDAIKSTRTSYPEMSDEEIIAPMIIDVPSIQSTLDYHRNEMTRAQELLNQPDQDLSGNTAILQRIHSLERSRTMIQGFMNIQAELKSRFKDYNAQEMARVLQQSSALVDRLDEKIPQLATRIQRTPEEIQAQRQKLLDAKRASDPGAGDYVNYFFESVAEQDFGGSLSEFLNGFTGQLKSEGLNVMDFMKSLGTSPGETIKATYKGMTMLKDFITSHPEQAKDASVTFLKNKLSTPKGIGELTALAMLMVAPGGIAKTIATKNATFMSALVRVQRVAKIPALTRVATASIALAASVPVATLRYSAKLPLFNSEKFKNTLSHVMGKLMEANPQMNLPMLQEFMTQMLEESATLLPTPLERADFIKLMSNLHADYEQNSLKPENLQALMKLYEQKAPLLKSQQ